jgi:hypothetical protein
MGVPPKPIVNAHPPDQRLQFRMDLRPASGGEGFPAPVAAKSRAHQDLWPDNHDGLEDRRKPAIQLDEVQAIAVSDPRTLRCSTISCCLSALLAAGTSPRKLLRRPARKSQRTQWMGCTSSGVALGPPSSGLAVFFDERDFFPVTCS